MAHRQSIHCVAFPIFLRCHQFGKSEGEKARRKSFSHYAHPDVVLGFFGSILSWNQKGEEASLSITSRIHTDTPAHV